MVTDYNNLNQLTTRSGGGVIPVRGKVSKPSNVAVNGKAANVDTNNVPWKFWAQVPVNVGTNQFTIVAKDGSGNASTNTYQLVISGGSGGTYSYDANGNLTSDGARTYTWDAENRLASVTANGNTSEFTYDGLGRRVKEKVNGILTKQWIWIGTVLAEERDGNNNISKRFYAQGEEISGTSYYYSSDHLGSIREMSDANGNVVAQYQYDSWGRKTKIAGSLDSDFGFTGHYYHAASGLYLTLCRAYDPDTARWLSKDPIEERGGLNLYGYVYNDPINGIDPLGLKTCWKWMILTTFGDRSDDKEGAFGDKLKKSDLAVGHTGKNQQPDKATPKDKNWVLPYGTKVNVYPSKSDSYTGTVKDVGAYDKKNPDKAGPGDWIDRWDPEKSKNKESDAGWVSIEVDDCQKCPSGWTGD